MKLKHPLQFQGSAFYRISIQGKISQSFLDQLSPIKIKEKAELDNIVTILSFQIKDQAELSGILNSIYEHHKSIIAIEAVNKSNNK